MGRAPGLTDVEKGQILALKLEKKSINYISKTINRSRNVISNFLKNPETYGTKKSTGRPKKLSLRARFKIVKVAAGKNITANKIIKKLDLNVHKNTVIRTLKNEGGLNRRKIKRKPTLNSIHKRNRLIFSGQYKDLKEKWKKVIFSDEKKFNLDGPDGYNYYWAGLGTKEPIYSRRAMGGKSVMVWGCFNYNGKSKLAIIKGNIDSAKYQKILEEYLLPFINRQNRREIIFQQDNARPHVSGSTVRWFEVNNIELMYWPAYSPDLNPIENVWGELARMVYSDGQVYNNEEELIKSINKNWEYISARYLGKLVDSMENRIKDVIENHGGSTKY